VYISRTCCKQNISLRYAEISPTVVRESATEALKCWLNDGQLLILNNRALKNASFHRFLGGEKLCALDTRKRAGYFKRRRCTMFIHVHRIPWKHAPRKWHGLNASDSYLENNQLEFSLVSSMVPGKFPGCLIKGVDFFSPTLLPIHLRKPSAQYHCFPFSSS
jgi:hypothetical protein